MIIKAFFIPIQLVSAENSDGTHRVTKDPMPFTRAEQAPTKDGVGFSGVSIIVVLIAGIGRFEKIPINAIEKNSTATDVPALTIRRYASTLRVIAAKIMGFRRPVQDINNPLEKLPTIPKTGRNPTALDIMAALTPKPVVI